LRRTFPSLERGLYCFAVRGGWIFLEGFIVPKINFEVAHELTADEAKGRLERKAEMLHSQFGDQVKDMAQSWDGNVLNFGFKTMGMRFDGTLGVEDKQVVVNGDLPFAAMMFKGKIESEVRQRLEQILRS
jgi:hypothetical protein